MRIIQALGVALLFGIAASWYANLSLMMSLGLYPVVAGVFLGIFAIIWVILNIVATIVGGIVAIALIFSR